MKEDKEREDRICMEIVVDALRPVKASGKFAKDTAEAIEDWHYWNDRGYIF